MSKGITYEAILSLSLEDIAQSFPLGAREVTKGRFEPADEGGATKTLRSLLRTKKDAEENKPLVYDAILDMPQDEFEWRFPNGIRAIKDRHEDRPEFKWRAAEKDERPHKTHAEVQVDRKQHRRMRSVTYLHRRSEMGYTEDTHFALDKTAPTPETDVLNEYAAKNHSTFMERQKEADAEKVAREDARRFAAYYKSFAVRAVRSGIDPSDLLVEFQRRIAEVESQLRKAS